MSLQEAQQYVISQRSEQAWSQYGAAPVWGGIL